MRAKFNKQQQQQITYANHRQTILLYFYDRCIETKYEQNEFAYQLQLYASLCYLQLYSFILVGEKKKYVFFILSTKDLRTNKDVYTLD